jgi:UDP-3-O-[3-hydroxymyristoyl] glucosamine N-acyltransferase
VVIGAHCVVGNGVSVGARTYFFPRVTLYDNISIGNDCRFQSGTVIGSEGFGYAWTAGGWSQIQQTGGVQIGNRVHVGANTTIDCGAIDPTVIADGVIMDNQIQIAHNVQIGENTAIAGCVGVAGSTTIGANCQIGGACNIVGHLRIADGVIINAASLVARSIVEAGRYGSGTPLQPDRIWRRSFVNLSKLDDLFRRLRRLERLNSID